MCSINPTRIPVFSTLANTFVLCDNWFCSLPTQTYPNRCCFHTGASPQYTNIPYSAWFKQSLPTLFDQMEEKNS